MDFVTAVKTCLNKYATFQGRASRSEYWFFTLFTVIVPIIASIMDGGMDLGPFEVLATLALLLPSTSVGVRRLHDTDRSGWWYLLPLIPLIGIIVLIIWFCTKGSAGTNRFGEYPLGAESVLISPPA
ncbi:MAG: DUF805 domain-containing protein [Rhodospirillaceae bacterium]|nr:DUF805 domain-containing protein [Rhodospirillales bacterium]